MIRNERQLAIARSKHAAALESASAASDRDDRRTFEEFAAEIEREINEYIRIVDGDQDHFPIEDLDALADAMVKARIARGLTQRELADRLGVSEQMVQRDEAGAYAHAKLSRLADVCDAMGYRFEGTLQPVATKNVGATGRRETYRHRPVSKS